MRQRKQAEIEKYIIHKNSTIIDYNYNVGDKVLVRINQAYKYETPFQGPYAIIQTWRNGTVTIKMGTVTSRLNIFRIKPYYSQEI